MRIGISNGRLSVEIPFISRSDEQKMWNDAGRSIRPAVCKRRQEEMQSAGLCGPQPLPRGGPQLTSCSSAPSAGCCPYDLQSCIVTMFYAVRRRRSECDSSPPQWGGGELRGSLEPQYPHASAYPAAEAISDKGRPQRRSVKNRKSFDCFKSAVRHPIQRSRKDDPEIISPRRFLVLPFVRTKGNV